MARAHLVENLRDADLLRTLGDDAVLEIAKEAANEIELLRAALDEAIAFESARTYDIARRDAPVEGITPQWWVDAVVVRPRLNQP
jgi:hypothetical protein